MNDVIIIGGGAAGIFASIMAKETYPSARVMVLEKHNTLLSKVRISGGGRCNVTHACFDPHLLVENYPRGHKELLGPFHAFNPQHTIEWFKKQDVHLKVESDGRIFPLSDSSSTIIDCLLTKAHSLNIEIVLQSKIEAILKNDSHFELFFKNGEKKMARKILLATGSSREGIKWAESLGHTIQEPVPSIFTFNIPQFSLNHLSGISVDPVTVRIMNTSYQQSGPLLITHFGLSGPAVLKLSAWSARFLYMCRYQTQIAINWLCKENEDTTYQILCTTKQKMANHSCGSVNLFHLPKNLWKALLEEIVESRWNTVSDNRLRRLTHKLHADIYSIEGKTLNKEEFVTCGGVSLNEINFKTMESKKCPGLFFAGEILDIDGITGGFNFQNAWTTGYIAGTAICC